MDTSPILTFTEAQLMQWLSPVVWPMIRILAMFMTAPVLSIRSIPKRVKIALALLTALAAAPSLPANTILLNSPQALEALLQQMLIGATMGFAARIVFTAMEFAGELIGLQMGLNYAGFFDPASGSTGTATGRFFNTIGAWLFVVLNGHLLMLAAVIRSFESFPVGQNVLTIVQTLQPQRWGAQIFELGLWLALPIITMLLFVNLVMGVISRVSQQLNIMSIGFPITLGVGLIGIAFTLPLLEVPFTSALERMLDLFA